MWYLQYKQSSVIVYLIHSDTCILLLELVGDVSTAYLRFSTRPVKLIQASYRLPSVDFVSAVLSTTVWHLEFQIVHTNPLPSLYQNEPVVYQ
jgi:hypothetical protein